MTIRGGFMGRLQGREEKFDFRDLDREALRMLWGYTKPYAGRLALAGLAMVGVTATTLAMPYLLKIAVDTYIAAGDLHGLTGITLIYLAVVGFSWLTSYWQSYLSSWVGQHVIYAVRRDLFRHLLRQSMGFYESERVGAIASRLTNDVDALSQVASSTVLSLLGDLLSFVGILIVLLTLSPRLTLALLAVVPIVIVSIGFLGKQMRRVYWDVQRALADVNAGVEQGVAGMRVTQSLSRESFSMEQFESLSLQNMRANLRAGLLFAAVFPTMTITNMLGMALVLGYGGSMVAKGVLSVGALLAFFSYTYRLFGPLRELSLVYNTFQAAAASVDRIAEYMHRQPDLPEPDQPQRPEDGFQGAVALRDVTFGYNPKEPVLHDVDLEIAPGETIALVGATGAGKSTLSKLIARLYDVQEGAVMLDGVDVRDIPQSELHRLVTFVPQDVFLFADSIGDNIRYGDPQADDEQVRAAAQRAQAHGFISRLPQGYDSPAGELGAMLSG
ncbi:MAG: ABC transporter ATP-binding protein, partial [Anaerolineae bacterium]